MKYSILLTAYDPDERLCEMSMRCINSIIRNSVGQDYELLIDIGPKGLFGAYNRLFKRAQGEYFIQIPNDTIIMDNEWLQKLSVQDKITSWHVGTFLLSGDREPDGGVTCYPRTIVDKIGYYDEQFDEGYGFGDNDYFMRAKRLGIEYQEVFVKLTHNGNTTYQTYWGEGQRVMYQHCLELFKKKWNL